MKKIILSVVCLFAATSYVNAETREFIMTDCGTVHETPRHFDDFETLVYLDFWTAMDCYAQDIEH